MDDNRGLTKGETRDSHPWYLMNKDVGDVPGYVTEPYLTYEGLP